MKERGVWLGSGGVRGKYNEARKEGGRKSPQVEWSGKGNIRGLALLLMVPGKDGQRGSYIKPSQHGT